MPHLTRFSYASNSTASPSTIREHLTTIIKDAKSSTNRGEMTGISIYGNDYFFHCTEAPASTIDQIYSHAYHSPLNKRFKLLHRELAIDRWFTNWDIKYAMQEPEIQLFFKKYYQTEKFNPHLLEGERLGEFINLFRQDTHHISDIKEVSMLSSSLGQLLTAHYISFMLIAALATSLLYLAYHYLGLSSNQMIYQ